MLTDCKACSYCRENTTVQSKSMQLNLENLIENHIKRG